MQAKAPLKPTSTIAFSGGPRRATPPRGVAECVRPCGLRIACGADLAELRRLAADRIGGAVTPLGALEAVHAKTGSTFLKFEEEGVLTGGAAVAQLTREGLNALLAGAFDPISPRLAHFASPNEEVSGLYGLAIAARTPKAAKAVVGAVLRLRAGIGDGLDFYARGATPSGCRVLVETLGCVELENGLFWSWPSLRRRAA